MDCPKCGADGVRVLMSRKDTDVTRIRRRRCVACDHHFFSLEVVIPDGGVEWVKGPRGMRRREGFKRFDFF